MVQFFFLSNTVYLSIFFSAFRLILNIFVAYVNFKDFVNFFMLLVIVIFNI